MHSSYRLREVVDKAETEVSRLQKIQMLVHHVKKVLAPGRVLDLLDEFGFVQKDHLAVEGLRFFTEAALHGEAQARRAYGASVTCRQRLKTGSSRGDRVDTEEQIPPGRSPSGNARRRRLRWTDFVDRAAKSKVKAAEGAEPWTLPVT